MTAWFSPGWHTLTPFWKHRMGVNHYRQCSAQDRRGTCPPELAVGDGKCLVHLSPLLPLHETSNWTRPSQPWGSPVFTDLSSSAWRTFPSYCEVKKETLTRVMCCWDSQPCTTWNGDNSYKCSEFVHSTGTVTGTAAKGPGAHRLRDRQTDSKHTHIITNLVLPTRGLWESSRGPWRDGIRQPRRTRLELRLRGMGLVSAMGFHLWPGVEGTGKHSYGGRRPTRCDSKKPETGDNDREREAGWCADRPLQRHSGQWWEVRFGGDGICGGETTLRSQTTCWSVWMWFCSSEFDPPSLFTTKIYIQKSRQTEPKAER